MEGLRDPDVVLRAERPAAQAVEVEAGDEVGRGGHLQLAAAQPQHVRPRRVPREPAEERIDLGGRGVVERVEVGAAVLARRLHVERGQQGVVGRVRGKGW